MATPALTSIARFAAYLRDHGFAVGVAEQQSMVRAALLIGIELRRLEAGWRAIVCRNPAEWRRYAELFRDFWLPGSAGARVRSSGQVRPRRDLRSAVAQMHESMAAAAHSGTSQAALSASSAEGTSRDAHAQGGASRVEALERSAASGWLPQDLARLQRVVEALAARLRRRLLRRQRAALHGRRLDLRRTLHASLRTGGVPFHARWLRRRRELPRLLFLVDVSRSMETFAQLFLRIARAFVQAMDARVFVFHTRLTEITALLQRDSGRVQEKINAVTAGFGGGTRIAASIDSLRTTHARQALTRAARLVIMSDGFDSDPPTHLWQALAAVRSRGARVYWLHPLARPPQSAALAQLASRQAGGSGALIDAFAPVHDLDSLARLDRVLR